MWPGHSTFDGCVLLVDRLAISGELLQQGGLGVHVGVLLLSLLAPKGFGSRDKDGLFETLHVLQWIRVCWRTRILFAEVYECRIYGIAEGLVACMPAIYL